MTSSEPAVSAATKTPIRAAVLCVDDEISILKSNPPMEGFMGQVGVHLKKRTSEI